MSGTHTLKRQNRGEAVAVPHRGLAQGTLPVRAQQASWGRQGPQCSEGTWSFVTAIGHRALPASPQPFRRGHSRRDGAAGHQRLQRGGAVRPPVGACGSVASVPSQSPAATDTPSDLGPRPARGRALARKSVQDPPLLEPAVGRQPGRASPSVPGGHQAAQSPVAPSVTTGAAGCFRCIAFEDEPKATKGGPSRAQSAPGPLGLARSPRRPGRGLRWAPSSCPPHSRPPPTSLPDGVFQTPLRSTPSETAVTAR